MKKWLDIISLVFTIGSEFARFWEIGKLTRIGALGYELKDKITLFANESRSKEARINSVFEALDLVLKYKRENPQDFEEIFSALERFSQKRKNDKSIDEKIANILWDNKTDS